MTKCTTYLFMCLVGKSNLLLKICIFTNYHWPGGSWKGTVRPSCGPDPSGLCSLELRESRTLNSMDLRKLSHLFSNITDTTTWLPSWRFPWMSYTLVRGRKQKTNFDFWIHLFIPGSPDETLSKPHSLNFINWAIERRLTVNTVNLIHKTNTKAHITVSKKPVWEAQGEDHKNRIILRNFQSLPEASLKSNNNREQLERRFINILSPTEL